MFIGKYVIGLSNGDVTAMKQNVLVLPSHIILPFISG
jgi:hypothetical protein